MYEPFERIHKPIPLVSSISRYSARRAPEVEKLASLAKKWKGRLVYRPELRPGDASPFSEYVGLNWRYKEVYYTDLAHWPEILHEMGHVFACLQVPDKSVEPDFLGWEIATVRLIGADFLEWRKDNNYAVDCSVVPVLEDRSMTDIQDLTDREFDSLVKTTLQISTKKGLIVNNNPVAIR